MHLYGFVISECPSINGYFVQSRRYAQILILEILLYIHPKGTYFVAPPVKIFACLDLEQNISFLDGHLLGKKGRKVKRLKGQKTNIERRTVVGLTVTRNP